MTEAQGTELLARVAAMLDHVAWVETWLQAMGAVVLTGLAVLVLIGIGTLWRAIR
jgi:hypothetical protein